MCLFSTASVKSITLLWLWLTLLLITAQELHSFCYYISGVHCLAIAILVASCLDPAYHSYLSAFGKISVASLSLPSPYCYAHEDCASHVVSTLGIAIALRSVYSQCYPAGCCLRVWCVRQLWISCQSAYQYYAIHIFLLYQV